MTPRVLMIAPVLAEYAREQARGLEESGQLSRLVTSWVNTAERAWWSGLPVIERLSRRPASPVEKCRLQRVPLADVAERATGWLGGSAIDAVDRRFALVDRTARHAVRAPIEMVFAQEDGCLQSFQRARSAGFRCAYHLPIAHHATVRSHLRRELTAFPDICTVSRDPRNFSPERTVRKDAELSLADQILCPSDFVRDSLVSAGVDPNKIRVLPFAADPEWLASEPLPRENAFLCVGQLSLRKGVHRVLQAWKRLGAYRTHRLRLIGAMRLTSKFLRDFSGLYEHTDWLPRPELRVQYLRAQALVLSSFAEGFAMVIPEAMSCGTPVLASHNSGAKGFVADGEEARLFDFDDVDGLTTALDWALTNPRELAAMGTRGRQRVERWTWPRYRDEFSEWIQTRASSR